MVYLIIGIELAEWALEQPQPRHQPGQIGPARRYLQLVLLGPLLVLLAVISVVLATFSEMLMWHQHLGHDDDRRFWAIIMLVLILLSTLMPSPGLSGG
ncbi:MAG: hypothetical protein ACR2RA_21135 [Geminicoccaceae bacterium]